MGSGSILTLRDDLVSPSLSGRRQDTFFPQDSSLSTKGKGYQRPGSSAGRPVSPPRLRSGSPGLGYSPRAYSPNVGGCYELFCEGPKGREVVERQLYFSMEKVTMERPGKPAVLNTGRRGNDFST